MTPPRQDGDFRPPPPESLHPSTQPVFCHHTFETYAQYLKVNPLCLSYSQPVGEVDSNPEPQPVFIRMVGKHSGLRKRVT